MTMISEYEIPEPMQYGWICPKCGTVWAPWQQCCASCLTGNTATVTTTNTPTGEPPVTVCPGSIVGGSDLPTYYMNAMAAQMAAQMAAHEMAAHEDDLK